MIGRSISSIFSIQIRQMLEIRRATLFSVAGLNSRNGEETMMILPELEMEAQDLMNLKRIKSCIGGFSDCAVTGEWYERQDGTRFWQVIVDSALVNLHCLVFNKAFYCRLAGISFPELRPCICEDLTEIDPDVKQGVLATIRSWESEEAGVIRVGD